MRRPDVAYYTSEQVRQMNTGAKVIPAFIVEFSSESDDVLKNLTKLHEYFDAGVQVVWWVYSVFREVYVYISPKSVTIATDADTLSAAPALPMLQITVAELFER